MISQKSLNIRCMGHNADKDSSLLVCLQLLRISSAYSSGYTDGVIYLFICLYSHIILLVYLQLLRNNSAYTGGCTDGGGVG